MNRIRSILLLTLLGLFAVSLNAEEKKAAKAEDKKEAKTGGKKTAAELEKEKALADPYPNDLGPDKLDVSAYPKEIQKGYETMVNRGGKCHSPARPLNSRFVETAGKDLGTLVDEYVKQFGESTGMTVSVDWRIAGESLELPPAAEVQLLRIVQEALANVRRHAAARNLRIAAAVEGGAFVLTVEDDGHGFDPDGRSRDGRPRFGLRTMAERAKAVGGTLAVESGPGAGTRVRVAVPLIKAHAPIGPGV